MTEQEISQWLSATDKRTGPHQKAEIIAYIKSKNPHRWWRINYDYRWLKKQMKRLGLDPNDAKELL